MNQFEAGDYVQWPCRNPERTRRWWTQGTVIVAGGEVTEVITDGYGPPRRRTIRTAIIELIDSDHRGHDLTWLIEEADKQALLDAGDAGGKDGR